MKGIEEEEEESDTPQNWDLASNHMDYTQPERERERGLSLLLRCCFRR